MPDFYPITVQGDTIQVQGLSGFEAYRWFCKTILDGEVPVWAPCGIELNPIKGNIAPHKSIAVMNNSFLETPLALIAKMKGIIFPSLHYKNNVVHMAPYNYAKAGLSGPQCWSTCDLFEQGRPDVHTPVLFREDYFCTILKGATVRFYACMDTGYHSMSDNHARMRLLADAKNYTAVASEHTLNDYVHVVAWDGHNIRVIYDNGMTPELFDSIWKGALTYGFS